MAYVGTADEGKVLTSAGVGASAKFASLTSPNGTITIGFDAPNVTLDLVGGGVAIETLTGNSGVATPIGSPGNINVQTANTTVQFAGSPGNLIQDFGLSNLLLGTSGTSITSGGTNTGVGVFTLLSVSSGSNNTAFGYNSQVNLTSGTSNTSIGKNCLTLLSTGINNTCLGVNAGNAYTTSESNNILIGSSILGTVGESNVIRIGQSGSGGSQQNKCFIGGIEGINVGSVARVVTEASDQLGTATITAGTGITVTPSANLITIAASGGGLTWTVITGASQAMAVNNGYIANRASNIAFTLPTVSAVGDVIEVTGMNTALGWTVSWTTNQQVFFGNATTTVTTGSLSSTATRDSIKIVCIVANLTWNVLSSIGNITCV